MSQLVDFPRFMIAVPPNVSTIRSPIDGQEGLAVFWTRAAAMRVARTKPGTVVVEATPEIFMDAIRKTHEMGVVVHRQCVGKQSVFSKSAPGDGAGAIRP